MDKTLINRWGAFGSRLPVMVLAVFLLGTLLFLPTLGYDFVWDDKIHVQETPQLKSLSSIPLLLLSDISFGKASGTGYYRPLIMPGFVLEYALFKENPAGYHLTNSIIHGINSSLVTYLAFLLFQNPYAALVAGALFALHPAHPEAVAFISARSDLLLTLFSLLALIALVKKSKENKLPFAAALFFFLALTSKETAAVVLIPMAIWLYQKSRQKGENWRQAGLKFLPLGLALMLYLSLRYIIVHILLKRKLALVMMHSPLFLPELFLRFLSFLIFPPQRASYFYHAPQPNSHAYPLDAKFWTLAVLTFLFVGIISYIIYRRRETAFFFALMLLPFLPALFISLHINTVMIDRFLYLPTVGLALLAAWGLLQVPEPWKKRAVVVTILILAAYLGGALWRTPLWKNDITFFEGLKKEYPSSPYVRGNLGMAYQHQSRYIESYQEISQAIRLDPLNFRYPMYLGRLYLPLGRIPEARAAFIESLRLAPDNAPALEGLGLTYALEGNYDLALNYLDMAIQSDPQNERYLKNKEVALMKKRALKK